MIYFCKSAEYVLEMAKAKEIVFHIFFYVFGLAGYDIIISLCFSF